MVNHEPPRLIERQCGGWLAVSPPYAALRIGVTGETEERARTLFDEALREWRKALTKELQAA